MEGMDYIRTSIKNIFFDDTYTPYEKIILIADLFKSIKNVRINKDYVSIITNNIYLKRIIDSFKEEDMEKVMGNKDISYILEDYDNYRYSDIGYEFSTKDSEMNEILKYYNSVYPKVPTKEENHKLLIKAKNGDKRARDELINSNWRLVFSIALYYQGRGLDLPDMFQEGNAGFIRAIDKYDLKKEVRITTYATWWIRNFIERGIINGANNIRYTARVEEVRLKIERTIKDLEVKLGRTPTIEDISLSTSYSKNIVSRVLSLPVANISLNKPISDEEDAFLEDVIPDVENLSIEDIVERKLLREKMLECLSSLDERKQQILKLRFGFYNGKKYNLEEVGRIFKITRERVRQLEIKAKKELEVLVKRNLDIKDTVKVVGDLDEKTRYNVMKLNKKANNIYDYFYTSSKEDIDIVFSLLDDSKKEITIARFSDNATEEQKEDFAKRVQGSFVKRLKELKMHEEDKEQYVKSLIQNVKKHRIIEEKSSITSIYDYYEGYRVEDIDLAVSFLPEKLYNILQDRFNGETCSVETRRLFSYRVSTILKNRLDNIRKNRMLELKEQIEKSKERDWELKIRMRNLLLSSLVLGFINGKEYSKLEACEIFDMRMEEVDSILKENLELYGEDNIKEISSSVYTNGGKENICHKKPKMKLKSN